MGSLVRPYASRISILAPPDLGMGLSVEFSAREFQWSAGDGRETVMETPSGRTLSASTNRFPPNGPLIGYESTDNPVTRQSQGVQVAAMGVR